MNGTTLRDPRTPLGRRALTTVLAVFAVLAAGARSSPPRRPPPALASPR